MAAPELRSVADEGEMWVGLNHQRNKVIVIDRDFNERASFSVTLSPGDYIYNYQIIKYMEEDNEKLQLLSFMTILAHGRTMIKFF
jgi:hypothetical protein